MLQVEALAQLGGIVMIDPEDKAAQNNFFFGGVDGVRWKKPVVPGDVLVRRQRGLGGVWSLDTICNASKRLIRSICGAITHLVHGTQTYVRI